jgi:hypothetical protein
MDKQKQRLCVKGQAEDGSEETLVEWQFVMFPGGDYVGVFPHLFPWAAISIDEDFYEGYDEAQWDLECGVWDSEDGRYIMHRSDFNEWRSQFADIRPYEIASGEVAQYRLELTLNQVAQAFLTLDQYLSTGTSGQPPDLRPAGRGYSLGLKSLVKKYIPTPGSEHDPKA